MERAAASLPSGAEAPEISFYEGRQSILSIALSGDGAREIQPLARQLEAKLARLDVGNVSVRGLPTDEIRVRFDQRQLSALGLTIGDVAAQIGRRNVDVSAGDVGGAGGLLRTLQKRQDLLGIVRLAHNPIAAGQGDLLVIHPARRAMRFAGRNASAVRRR